MSRRARMAPGGLVYHALNRAVARLPLFQKEGDYAVFQQVMAEAMERHPTRLLAFCLMPNHWHMVLWPRHDGELTAFLRWLTHTHTMRWHAHYHSSGTGHLYQGRFKAFAVETDEYFYTVMRYVERNALRANLVRRAEDWRWSSLWVRRHGDAQSKSLLDPWPTPMPRNWIDTVNAVETDAELKAVRRAVNRGSPLGSEAWQQRIARRLGLEYTLRSRGRPKNQKRKKIELRPLFSVPWTVKQPAGARKFQRQESRRENCESARLGPVRGLHGWGCSLVRQSDQQTIRPTTTSSAR